MRGYFSREENFSQGYGKLFTEWFQYGVLLKILAMFPVKKPSLKSLSGEKSTRRRRGFAPPARKRELPVCPCEVPKRGNFFKRELRGGFSISQRDVSRLSPRSSWGDIVGAKNVRPINFSPPGVSRASQNPLFSWKFFKECRGPILASRFRAKLTLRVNPGLRALRGPGNRIGLLPVSSPLLGLPPFRGVLRVSRIEPIDQFMTKVYSGPPVNSFLEDLKPPAPMRP